MSENDGDCAMSTDEGIIVEHTLDVLRLAAEKVLFEFSEKAVDESGAEISVEEIKPGDSVIFEENIQPCPNRVIATKLHDDAWFVIFTAETPPGGYPSGRDATKAAQSEERKLKILTEFLTETAGADHVTEVRNWKPEMKAEAADVLSIIDRTKRRWGH